jgi:hypothetical protein
MDDQESKIDNDNENEIIDGGEVVPDKRKRREIRLKK